MNLRLFCLTIVMAAVGSVSLHGQVMGLKDCMEYAISNSTKVRIRNAETADARIARRDAVLRAFMPSISADSYAYYNFGRSIDPQTNTYFNQTSFHNSYGISAGIILFDGFSAVNNMRISKTGLDISQSRERQAQADICLAVMEAYYNSVYYSRLASVYQERVNTVRTMLDKIRRQEQLGQKGYADVIQAESDLADSEYELVNALNMSRDQLTILSDLMFWPDDRPLRIDTVLTIPDNLQDMAFEPANAVLDNNPDYRIAASNLLNSRRELSTARWQLLPRLSLYAGWNTNYFTMDGNSTAPFAEQFRNNSGEYVQLSVSIPLFDRLQKHSAVARKRNALTVAQAEKEQKCREIEQEYRRATQDCEGAMEAYRQAAVKAGIQEEAYRLNMRKLEQGLVSQLEFRAINDALLKSKADLMNSLFRLLIKRSVVEYYEGTDYIDQ